MDKLKTEPSNKGCSYLCLLIGSWSIICAFVCFAISTITNSYSSDQYAFFLCGITLGLIGVPLCLLGGILKLVGSTVKAIKNTEK